MSDKAPPARGRKPKPKAADVDVQGGRLPRQIMGLLAPLHDHCPDPKRKLHYDELALRCFCLAGAPGETLVRCKQRRARKLVLHSFRHTYATLMAGQVQNNPTSSKRFSATRRLPPQTATAKSIPPVVPVAQFDLSLAQKPKATADIHDVPRPESA